MWVKAYIRVSTDEQAELGNSLNEQKERLTAYCRAMDWEAPEWYIDDGYSAKDTKRPDMTRLIEDIKVSKGEGAVITTKLDRLSRNLFDILSLTRFFEKYDCKYVSATEAFDTSTAAGRLTLQVLGMVAEFERSRNSERVKENMLSLARAGDRVITRPCYGYDIINGNREINIEEAVIVRKMADLILEGHGSRYVAKKLNEMGIKTKDGNQWHDKIVRELLQRETLIGDFVYNKTTRKNDKVVKVPEKDWVVIEGTHDPILDRDTFDKMKAIFQGRKTVGRHMKDDRYLLSGLVKCVHCGSKMNGRRNAVKSKSTGEDIVYYRYMCDGYLKKGTCFFHFVHRDDLEKMVIDRIKKIAESVPGALKLNVQKKQDKSLEKELLLSQLRKLDRRLQKQLEAYEDDLISASDLKLARQRVEEERKRISLSLEELENGESDVATKKIHDNAKRLVDIVTGDNRLKAKFAIREIVQSIGVENGENVTITWFPK